MVFFEKNKDKICSKYTLKRTKLHRFKKFSRGSMPPNPPSNAHGFFAYYMVPGPLKSVSSLTIWGPP